MSLFSLSFRGDIFSQDRLQQIRRMWAPDNILAFEHYVSQIMTEFNTWKWESISVILKNIYILLKSNCESKMFSFLCYVLSLLNSMQRHSS